MTGPRPDNSEGTDLRARLTTAAQVAPFALLVFVLVVVPLALLASYSFRESSFLGVGDGPTLEQYRLVFENSSTLRVMLRTALVATAVALAVTFLAFVMAYALAFRLRGRTGLIALGVVVASGIASLLVRIFAWGSILANNGVINESLEFVGLVSAPLDFLFLSYFAVGVTMTYLYLPFGVLIIYSSMQGIDRFDVEASRDLGSGRWRTVARVVAPQARVGLAGAFVLTAVLAVADFVTPRLVGGPQGLMVGSVVQDLALTGGDLPGAAALALSFLVLFAAALAGLYLLVRLMRPLLRILSGPANSLAAKVAVRTPARLSRISLSVPVAAVLLVYMVAPTILVILFSFNAAPSTGLPITGLTTDWYPEIVGRSGFGDALKGSLIITSIAVTVATLVALPMAFALNKAEGLLSKSLWLLIFLPFVIPGVLLGSALLVASDETGIPLGLATTAVVHIMLLVSEITLIVYARLHGLDRRLVEAARDLGASVARALRTVTLPLLLPAIVGAAMLAAAVSLDEIFITTFTIGSDDTLPVWLFGQARRGFTPGINAVGVMLLLGTLIAFALAVASGRRSVLGK